MVDVVLGEFMENLFSESIPDVMSGNGIQKNKKDTIFVWIDILGFSDALDDESKYEQLSNYLNFFSKLFSTSEMDKLAKYRKISDGIILQLRNDIRSPDVVNEFFKKIVECQKKMFDSELYVRGGIAIGSKYETDDENFISNGLARAVKLESNVITWPVIGTDEKNLNRMNQIYGSDLKKYFSITYSKSGSEVYYLNPFLELDTISQKRLYMNVVENIKKNEKKPQVLQKYLWIQRIMENVNRDLIKLRCPKCGEM